MTAANAVIYRLSGLPELHDRINELRFAAETREYEAALKEYNRKRRGRRRSRAKSRVDSTRRPADSCSRAT